MTPEKLLEALLDWGVFNSLGSDDYGRQIFAIGDEGIGGISGMDFDRKWPEITDEILAEELKKFAESR